MLERTTKIREYALVFCLLIFNCNIVMYITTNSILPESPSTIQTPNHTIPGLELEFERNLTLLRITSIQARVNSSQEEVYTEILITSIS